MSAENQTTPAASPPAESPSAKPTQPRGKWPGLGSWRFTIREIMLLTAAVAGFLAWANLFYQRSQPYQRTPIPDQIGNQGEIRDICTRLGHQFSSYSAGGGGSGDMHGTTRTYNCQLDLPKELRGRFMEEYRDHIRALLDKHAGSVSGGGTTRDDRGLRDFEFDYAKGTTRGTVIIRSLSGDADLSLLIFVHEYDDKQ